jgi:hypothetical protein
LAADLKLSINPKLEIDVVRIREDVTCVCIDNFLLNPQDAVDYACERAGEFVMLERSYPGVVLPVPSGPMEGLHRFIRGEMSRLFPFCRGGIDFHTQFSLASVAPEDFTWIQRLCHSDPRLSRGRVNFAALLYLFDNPDLGGTGFYRWRDPDFWLEMSSLQQDDPEAGLDVLKERFQMFRDPPCYMTESNEAAELLDVAPARFNRLIFYSGDVPHSAFIRQPELLSDDPATGRLTLNCFASALPKK